MKIKEILAVCFMVHSILAMREVNNESITNQVFQSQFLPSTTFMNSSFRNVVFMNIIVNYKLVKSNLQIVQVTNSSLRLNFEDGEIRYFYADNLQYEKSELKYFTAEYMYLSYASFKKNKLMQGRISRSNFNNLKMDETTISIVNILNTNFQLVSLKNMTFTSVNFTNCSFVNVQFNFSELDRCSFIGCTFSEVSFDNVVNKGSQINGKQFSQFLKQNEKKEEKCEKQPKNLVSSVEREILLIQLSELSKQNAYLYYMLKMNKQMPKNPNQRRYRQAIFLKNLQSIIQFNKYSERWKKGINKFTDLTEREFQTLYAGDFSAKQIFPAEALKINSEEIFQTVDIDWRQREIITPVKDQGACASSWAFAATAFHQSYHILEKQEMDEENGSKINHEELDLSEQQLIDCSTFLEFENYGCQGGFKRKALNYITAFGQTTQQTYPYLGRDCNRNEVALYDSSVCCSQYGGKFKINKISNRNSCDSLAYDILSAPVLVSVSMTSWQHYHSGVISEQDCKGERNHAALLVGIVERGWILKNSWGPEWGEDGYIYLQIGNTCGICEQFSIIE